MNWGTQEDLENTYEQYVNQYIILNERSVSDYENESSFKTISKDHFDKIDKAVKIINKFNFFIRKRDELKMNHADILDIESIWEGKLVALPPQKRIELNDTIYIDANRRLTNFITSIKTFIDDLLIKKILPKDFGRGSHEVIFFKRKSHYWYDHHFSYRFLVRLRDYAVHYNFPVQSVDISSDLNSDADVPFKFELKLNFVKDKLIENRTFNDKLGSDLSLYNYVFPLMPVLQGITFIFDEILVVLLYLYGEEYVTAAEFIKSIIDDAPNPVTVSYGKIVKEDGKIGPHTKIIPKKAAAQILLINQELNG